MAFSYMRYPVPYVFVAKMRDTTKRCGSCKVLVQDINEHRLEHKSEITFEPPFQNMILRPGPWHIELNMARLLLSFLWIPVMKSLASDFGFRTKLKMFLKMLIIIAQDRS